MNKKRIVITGVGVVSPLGIGKEAFWQALNAGKDGIRPISLFDTTGLKVDVGGEISGFDPKRFFEERTLMNIDRASNLVSAACKLAIEDAGLEINDDTTDGIGVSVGATFANLQSLSEFDQEALIKGPQLVNPSNFPNTVANASASRISIRFKVKGFNATISTGICSAIDALDYGVKFIRLHNKKAVIVGAVEALCEQIFHGYYKLKYLAGLKDGARAISCPFDRRRNGIVCSEAAGVIIVEELEAALARNAPVYAEVLAVSSTYGSNEHGLAAAMNLALERGKLLPEQIDYICANANSTRDADRNETYAIKRVWKDAARKAAVSAIKSMLGETYSASASLAIIASIGAMQRNFIPPTIHYEEKDQELDLDYTVNKARQYSVGTAMINASDPNGANSVLILKKYKGS